MLAKGRIEQLFQPVFRQGIADGKTVLRQRQIGVQVLQYSFIANENCAEFRKVGKQSQCADCSLVNTLEKIHHHIWCKGKDDQVGKFSRRGVIDQDIAPILEI
jgi:hypothetical protein